MQEIQEEGKHLRVTTEQITINHPFSLTTSFLTLGGGDYLLFKTYKCEIISYLICIGREEPASIRYPYSQE